MSDIPPEEIIFNNILSRLPVKSLIRFRCVCKSWCELFRNPNFIKMHLKHANEQKNHLRLILRSETNNHVYTMDYDPTSSTCDDNNSNNNNNKPIEIDYGWISNSFEFEIYGSCNGLLCISTTYSRKFIILWNPSTREYYKDIPPFPCDDDPYLIDSFDYGFWYDCKIEDYKVVGLRLYHNDPDIDFIEVMVYTLGSNSWGSYQRIPRYNYINWRTERRMPINGVLHWLAEKYIGSVRSDVILCFDVVEERFKEMPLPYNVGDRIETYVTTLGGSLGLLKYDYGVSLDVWEMKEYGVMDSWTKVFTTTDGSFASLSKVQCLDKDATTLVVKDCNAQVLDEPNNAILTTDANLGWGFKNCVYVGSLVSLNSATYATKRRPERA